MIPATSDGATPGPSPLDPSVDYVLGPSTSALPVSDAVVLFDRWGDNFPPPFDALLNFLEGVWIDMYNWFVFNVVTLLVRLWDKVTSEVNRLWEMVWRYVSNTVSSWAGWLRDRVADLVEWLRNALSATVNYFWSWVAARWQDITNTWVFVTVTLPRWIGDRLGDLGRFIGDSLGATGRWIGDLLGATGHWLGDLIGATGRWLGDRLGALGAFLDSVHHSLRAWDRALAQNIGSTGSSVQNAVIDFIQHNLIDPLGDWLAQIWAAITRFWDWLKSGLGNLLRQLGTWLSQLWNSELIQSLIASAGSFLGWFFDLLRRAAGVVWDIVGHRVPRGPGGAPEAIQQALSVTASLAGTMAAAKIGGQAVLPWISGLDRSLTTALKEVTDFSEVNSRWVRPLFDSYLGQPTFYYFNYLFRNRLPGPSELIGLVGEYQISSTEYKDTLGYYGITDEWAENLIELAYRPVPLFRLVDIATMEVADDPWVVSELKKSSYRPVTIDRLLAFIDMQRFVAGAKSGLATLAKLYKDGFYTVEQLRRHYEAMGYHPRTIDGYIAAAQWEEIAEWHAEVMAVWGDAYAKDMLTEQDYRGRLAQEGVNQQRIDNIVLRANIRKVPAPERKRAEPPKPIYQQPQGPVTERALTLEYENDLIDRGTYILRLRALEMPAALVDATVDLADARKQVAELKAAKPVTPQYDTDAGRLSTRTLLLLFWKREIGEPELRAGLKSLEMPAALVDAYVANAKAHGFQPEKPEELPIPHFPPNSPQAILLVNSRIAYRQGELDAVQFGDILIDLGYRPQDARAVIDAENLIRKEPVTLPPPIIPPFEPRSPEAVMYSAASTAYRQATMTAADFEAILVKLGYHPEDAIAIRKAEDLVRKRATA